MNSIPHRNNNSLDQLDKGWFHCYKIVLTIYLVLVALGTIILCAYSLYTGANMPMLSGTLVMNLMVLLLLTWQLEAIQKRDLEKAKQVLTYFTFYLVLDVAYILGMSYATYGSFASAFTAQAGAALGIFIASVFFGSVQVYLFLKKHQAGGYQNMNYVAP